MLKATPKQDGQAPEEVKEVLDHMKTAFQELASVISAEMRDLESHGEDVTKNRVTLECEQEGFRYTLTQVRMGGPAELTRRETEIASLVASGLPNRAIAKRLGICRTTVAAHLQNVFRKFGISSRTELVREMLSGGGASP